MAMGYTVSLCGFIIQLYELQSSNVNHNLLSSASRRAIGRDVREAGCVCARLHCILYRLFNTIYTVFTQLCTPVTTDTFQL